MNPYAVAAILVGVAAAQAAIAPHLAILGVRPNLPLIVVTAWGLLRGSGEGIWWGLGTGLALDLFSGVPLGMFSGGLVLAGFIAGVGERQVFRTHFLMPVIAITVNTLLANLAAMGAMKLLNWPVPFGALMTTAVLPEMAYNVIGILVVFPVLAWVSHRIEDRSVEL
ncbi:MAG: rod shape-determining protein MreD [Anaerolineae bacterium]|nr:rod shape-determining protein MreD [Anaerolineae bacterium]